MLSLKSSCWRLITSFPSITRSFSTVVTRSFEAEFIRLVTPGDNGESTSKVISKSEALKLAETQRVSLILGYINYNTTCPLIIIILVNGSTNPPMCRLDLDQKSEPGMSHRDKRLKEKERKANQAKPEKEVSIRV